MVRDSGFDVEIDERQDADHHMQCESRSASLLLWMAGALDQIDYGLMHVDSVARLLYANRAGHEWLESRNSRMRLRRGCLEAIESGDGGRLRRAVSDAASRGLRSLLTLGHDEDAIALAFVPIRHDAGGDDRALIVVGRQRVCEGLTAQFYSSRHGLTSAESRVLQLLCAGASPGEIARTLKVAVSTVRTQISSIRAKTGAPTVGALLRKVALLPPLVDAFRSAGTATQRATA